MAEQRTTDLSTRRLTVESSLNPTPLNAVLLGVDPAGIDAGTPGVNTALSTADALWLAAALVRSTGITPDMLARAVEEAT